MARIQAVKLQMEASARWIPGQIRRPKPNTHLRGSIARFCVGSVMVKYRSGSKVSGLENRSRLRVIAQMLAKTKLPFGMRLFR